MMSALTLLIALQGAPAVLPRLRLECEGFATVDRSGPREPDAPETHAVGLMIDTTSEPARIRPPRVMVPFLSGIGHDTWWPVPNLKASGDTIAGSFRFSIIDNARFSIDRRSGTITFSSAAGSFRGHCAPEATERQF